MEMGGFDDLSISLSQESLIGFEECIDCRIPLANAKLLERHEESIESSVLIRDRLDRT